MLVTILYGIEVRRIGKNAELAHTIALSILARILYHNSRLHRRALKAAAAAAVAVAVREWRVCQGMRLTRVQLRHFAKACSK